MPVAADSGQPSAAPSPLSPAAYAVVLKSNHMLLIEDSKRNRDQAPRHGNHRQKIRERLPGRFSTPEPSPQTQATKQSECFRNAARILRDAQLLRLSAIYAALDRSPVVDACHLQAALAVWDYCRDSARLLFDTAPSDPTARRISEALDVNPQGLSRVQIRALFHRHVSKDRIDQALEQLMALDLIHRRTTAGRGRSATVWNKPVDMRPPETDPYGA